MPTLLTLLCAFFTVVFILWEVSRRRLEKRRQAGKYFIRLYKYQQQQRGYFDE